mgnify:CR=1 FL=1
MPKRAGLQQTPQEAAKGLAEAQVIEAKAAAKEKDGTAEANVMKKKFTAEAVKLEYEVVKVSDTKIIEVF